MQNEQKSLIRSFSFAGDTGGRRQGNAISDLQPEVRRGRAFADGDLQQAAAADERQRIAGRSVLIRPANWTEVTAGDGDVNVCHGGDDVDRDIGRGVAEVIDVNDLAALSQARGWSDVEQN